MLYWPGGLADVSVPHIICENTLSLVLQQLHTPHLTQSTGLRLEEDNCLHAATLCWVWRKISEPRRGGAWCLQTIFHHHTHRDMISNTALTSVSRAGDSEAALVVRSWDMSQATDHWHRCSRNKSFQHSWSNNIWTKIFTDSNNLLLMCFFFCLPKLKILKAYALKKVLHGKAMFTDLIRRRKSLKRSQTLGPPDRHEEESGRSLLESLPGGGERWELRVEQGRRYERRRQRQWVRRMSVWWPDTPEVPVPVHSAEEGVEWWMLTKHWRWQWWCQWW